MHALICGGGVGGLSTAISLKKAGYEVTVFEQSDELRTTGSGLNLWPNAGRALHDIGLKEGFEDVSIALDYYLVIASSGEVIHKKDVRNWKTRFGAPATGVHRLDLTKMLAENVGSENIKFGHRLIGYEEDNTQVICHFTNGETIAGDFLIGADGIHSVVRELMIGKFDYRPNNHRAYRWRGVASLSDTDVHPKAETEVLDGKTFFGSIPIKGDKIYWYCSGPELNDYESLINFFQSWDKTHVPKTIAATPRDTIFETELLDLKNIPRPWTSGRIALLGDAAHPMMPDMAQGASQTFVDAQAIGECLKESTDQTIVKDLKRFEILRGSTAEHVVNLSKSIVTLEKRDSEWVVDPIADKYEKYVEGFEAPSKPLKML